MDNAAKALMIAGEMLIAILIVGLIASIVSKFGNFSSNMNNKMNKDKQEEFNNHFFAFQGRIDITAAEIVGIANYAKECNEKSELFLKNDYSVIKKSPDFVDVLVNTNGGKKSFFNVSKVSSDNEYNKKIKEFLEGNNHRFFSCNAVIESVTSVSSDESYVIRRKTVENGDIELEENDNGRKGYVRFITFNYTKNKVLNVGPHSNENLTIFNRNDFVINN